MIAKLRLVTKVIGGTPSRIRTCDPLLRSSIFSVSTAHFTGFQPGYSSIERQKSATSAFANLWCRYGCPQRMKIHVRKTGEEITLIDGLPVTLTSEKNPLSMQRFRARNRELRIRQPVTLTRICEGCKTEFRAERKTAKYCSARCRVKATREQKAEKLRQEHEPLLANAS